MLKNNIYIFTIAAGLILVILIWISQGVSVQESAANKMVDGKIPPELSSMPMHMRFIDEATCLICHEQEKELKLQGETLIAGKMPHEFREDCIQCHVLPE